MRIDERNTSTQNHPAIGNPMNAMTPTVFRAERNVRTSTWGRFSAKYRSTDRSTAGSSRMNPKTATPSSPSENVAKNE